MKRAAQAAIRHLVRFVSGERPSRWEMRRRLSRHLHRSFRKIPLHLLLLLLLAVPFRNRPVELRPLPVQPVSLLC